MEAFNLKDAYRKTWDKLPHCRHLLQPRRYTLEGQASAHYPSSMESFIVDVHSVIQAMDDIRALDRNPGVISDTLRENPAIRHTFPQALRIAAGYPVYYLGMDIGEALLDTEPPSGIPVSEIKWVYPAMRIFLPNNWFKVAGKSIRFLDIALFPPGADLRPNAHVWSDVATATGRSFIPGHSVYLPDDSAAISVQGWVNEEERGEFMHYWAFRKWTTQTLGEMLSSFDLKAKASDPALVMSESESEGGEKMLHLAVNIIMLLGTVPEEVEEEKLLRKEKRDKKNAIVQDALWAPRFIGQPFFGKIKPKPESSDPNGVKHYGEVRRAHWKRQPHGPGRSERKIIWVSLYRTRSQEDRAGKPNG
jgi:hypothetical protein